MVELRAAHPGDADELAPRLRAADRAELQAVHGANADPRNLLHQSLRMTPGALAAVAGGEVVALLGCAEGGTLLNPYGVPWLLASDGADRHARVFIVEGRRLVGEWLARHGRLMNWADARNTRTLRWLARIGFTIEPARPYGRQGLPFHRFTAGG